MTPRNGGTGVLARSFLGCAEHVRQLGGACIKKTSNRHAVRKMKEGPSESPCRRRLQTAISCFGSKTAVVNVMVKRRDLRSRHVGIREMSANDPPRKHRKADRRHPKPGPAPRPGISMTGTYLLVMWGPVCRRHDSYPGFRTELENRVDDAKGKAQVEQHEAESTDASTRGALLRSSEEAG